MDNILSAFLVAGLLPIGEDDEKLKFLEAAAGDLAKQIAAAPLLAYRFALVGLSDQAVATDPALKKAEEALVSKWQTVANKIGASPVQVYRAILLRALELAAEKSSAIKQAIGLIAHNEPLLKSSGKEREAIDGMLERLAGSVAEDLTAVWIGPVKIVLPKPSVKAKKAITKEQLKMGLARAAGPQDAEGTALNMPNPHWSNAGEPWSHEFAGRAADAIYAAFQNSTKEFLEEMEGGIHDSIKDLVVGLERLAIRDAKSELLWIRMSMYSPSARDGYRNLKAPDVLLHAVLDVVRAIAPAAPPSVEFFLRDLVATLTKKKLRLVAALPEIGPKLKDLPEATSILNDPLPAAGRRPWLDVAVRPDATSPFDQQTGVSIDYEDTEPEMAVRFYRELQIRKLLCAVQ